MATVIETISLSGLFSKEINIATKAKCLKAHVNELDANKSKETNKQPYAFKITQIQKGETIQNIKNIKDLKSDYRARMIKNSIKKN